MVFEFGLLRITESICTQKFYCNYKRMPSSNFVLIFDGHNQYSYAYFYGLIHNYQAKQTKVLKVYCDSCPVTITMSLQGVRIALSAIDKFSYVALAILGFYFIYQGQVIQRFSEEKTIFAEYDEALEEFPTMTTHIMGKLSPMPEYGSGFNISMGVADQAEPMRDLTFGENILPGSRLKVYFERYGEHAREFRITPLNFDPDMPVVYRLKYKFGKLAVSKVSLRLSTDISDLARWDGRSFSYEDEEHQCQIGEGRLLIISATKYKYLNCTNKSPVELLAQQFLNELPKKCTTPCKLKPQLLRLGFKLDKITAHLPFCQKLSERKCLLKVLTKIRKDAFRRACSKIEYKAIANELENEQGWKNQAFYKLALANGEAKANVKEENLIYDGVAMISAIGGTFGLCVGFSFYNLSNYFIGWLECRIKNSCRQA